MAGSGETKVQRVQEISRATPWMPGNRGIRVGWGEKPQSGKRCLGLGAMRVRKSDRCGSFRRRAQPVREARFG
jgi:hypothetical protein